jgi:alanine racemase
VYDRVVAQFDRDALWHNFSVARACAPDSRVMAMLKANAYGHGLLWVASVLEEADAFGVHSLGAAMALRKAMPHKRIVLLAGVLTREGFEFASANRLECVIHDQAQLAILKEVSGVGKLGIWVKLNTGMHRLGFMPGEVPRVRQVIASLSCISEVCGWMTHFSEASNIASAETNRQMQTFIRATDGVLEAKSAANSAAILAWSKTHLDWVRPGLMLYGGSPLDHKSAHACGLRPVMTLGSKLIAIQRVKKGMRLGYDRSWLCYRDAVIGIVSVGYGDGYPRHAAFGTPVLVGEVRCPLVGRVCMDLIHVDLTDHEHAKVGDDVVLWGQDLPIDEVARTAGTISYELFCHVSSRVNREVIEPQMI